MSNEIRCPNCGQVFTIDETMYDSIVKQVRDAQFTKELESRKKDAITIEQKNFQNQLQKVQSDYQSKIAQLESLIENNKKTNQAAIQQLTMEKKQALDVASLQSKQQLTEAMNKKDQEIESLKAKLASKDQEKDIAIGNEAKKNNIELNELKALVASLQAQLKAAQNENKMVMEQANSDKKQAVDVAKMQSKQELTDMINTKDREIEGLKAQLAAKTQEQDIAVSNEAKKSAEALAKLNTQVATLQTELNAIKQQADASMKQAVELVKMEAKQELTAKMNEKNTEITSLQSQLASKDQEKALALTQVTSQKDQEIGKLTYQIEMNQSNFEKDKQTIKEDYEYKLKMKNDEVEYYRDLKARQSTKMIGETLEQHCSVSFNQLRPTAFKNAYFEKDNDARTGSKGDFIFRDYDDDGTEIVSIMFEMKNEADTTATKHKNEDFFKELDKDRKEKNCEYAVLVSLLEADNELYNNGIVDVSYKYEKMYVIRPQFFIPMITLLRNASLNATEYKKQLEIERNQNIDISHFEENMVTFQAAFSKNYESAKSNFTKAIDEIDKSIDHLQKIKSALTTSENQLRLANNKAQDLSIKKLTKNAPSVKAMFDDLKNQ